MRIAFAGDRDISVQVLDFILSNGVKPLALLLPDDAKSSHDEELMKMCSFLERDRILEGSLFCERKGIELIRQLDLDYIICIHFPYIVPEKILRIPRLGVLNLHPAFLPFSRGWHSATWAILEGTPIGATLHLMDAGIDSGPIIHQKRLDVSPGDTADALYKRVKMLELEIFKEAWPQLVLGNFKQRPQNINEGTIHKRQDLFERSIQRIDLEQSLKVGDLIRRLRALTTNQIQESAYYDVNGKRYRIQVLIRKEMKRE